MGISENSYGHALLQKSVMPSYENSVPRTYTPRKKVGFVPLRTSAGYPFSISSCFFLSSSMILSGDANCDLTKMIANQPIENHARHMSEVYKLFSFKQLIQEPTRVSLTTSSLIDHIAKNVSQQHC